MSKPKLLTAEQNFRCNDCGKCCRDWHVEVSAEEQATVAALCWQPEDDIPQDPFFRWAGHTYLAHRADGSCAFFDPKAHNCRIHAKFGAAKKPLGCQLYPFQASRLPDERPAVRARLDCPAALVGEGRPLSEQRQHLAAIVQRLPALPCTDQYDRAGLHVETIFVLLKGLNDELLAADLPLQRIIMGVNLAAHRLHCLGPTFLNDAAVRNEVLQSFYGRIISDVCDVRKRRLILIEHWRLMSLLATYMRRDERLIRGGLAARVQNANTIRKLSLGRGSLRELGAEHPEGIFGHRDLLAAPIPAPSPEQARVVLDFFRVHLQTHQFYGGANFSFGFFDGLHSLALAGLLALAAARWRSLCEHRNHLQLADIHYGVAAIDHGFGRQEALRTPLLRILARQTWQSDAFNRLALTLICDPHQSFMEQP